MTFQIERPGIYFDVPEADYFADCCPAPSLTQSLAKILIEKSPAHAAAEHPKLTPPVEEDEAPEKYDASRAIGNAAHAVLIGRGKTLEICAFNNWQTKDAKTAKADALAAGLTPILSKHYARAMAMVDAIRRQLADAGLETAFVVGNGEVVMAWQEDGMWFRSMIDWMVNPTLLYDLKSTALSVAPHAIPNLMTNAGWDIQAAMHERGLDVLDPDGRGRRKFRFIAVENEPPFALTPVEMTEAAMTMGRKKLAFAVNRWKVAMASGHFPAYPLDLCRPTYPGYAENRWLEREVEESERVDLDQPLPVHDREVNILAGG